MRKLRTIYLRSTDLQMQLCRMRIKIFFTLKKTKLIALTVLNYLFVKKALISSILPISKCEEKSALGAPFPPFFS